MNDPLSGKASSPSPLIVADALVENELRPEKPDSAAPSVKLPDDWLRDFYKECGREVTLSYTTLNQMKNWAIVVQGTIIAAVAAFGRSAFGSGALSAPKEIGTAIVSGAVLAYLFTIRFMVRSILCYINLLRWNRLQAAIVSLKLPPAGCTSSDLAARESELQNEIQQYYHGWASPISRRQQIASSLKLGFGLLLALPAALMIWGSFVHWDDTWVRGLVTLSIGGTLIEAADFFSSRFFDTPEKAARRKNKTPIFPAPTGTIGYILSWLVNVAVSSWVVFPPIEWAPTLQIVGFTLVLVALAVCADLCTGRPVNPTQPLRE